MEDKHKQIKYKRFYIFMGGEGEEEQGQEDNFSRQVGIPGKTGGCQFVDLSHVLKSLHHAGQLPLNTYLPTF